MANHTKGSVSDKKMKTTICTDGARGFFERGKEIAKLVDTGKSISPRRVINFDSAEEMLAILTKARRNLIALLRKGDASITDIAHLLHRDRSAVAKDIKLLEHYGLVIISDEINPGHGQRKIVHAISKQPIMLEAAI